MRLSSGGLLLRRPFFGRRGGGGLLPFFGRRGGRRREARLRRYRSWFVGPGERDLRHRRSRRSGPGRRDVGPQRRLLAPLLLRRSVHPGSRLERDLAAGHEPRAVPLPGRCLRWRGWGRTTKTEALCRLRSQRRNPVSFTLHIHAFVTACAVSGTLPCEGGFRRFMQDSRLLRG